LLILQQKNPVKMSPKLVIKRLSGVGLANIKTCTWTC
jgi:hypothetical protein